MWKSAKLSTQRSGGAIHFSGPKCAKVKRPRRCASTSVPTERSCTKPHRPGGLASASSGRGSARFGRTRSPSHMRPSAGRPATRHGFSAQAVPRIQRWTRSAAVSANSAESGAVGRSVNAMGRLNAELLKPHVAAPASSFGNDRCAHGVGAEPRPTTPNFGLRDIDIGHPGLMMGNDWRGMRQVAGTRDMAQITAENGDQGRRGGRPGA